MNIHRISTSVAVFILLLSFSLMLASSWNDSVIFDETAHIGAGYSYLTLKDMRLNPEHPPLIKDIAAFPLLFLNLNFLTKTDGWENQLNGQWDQGGGFMFDFANNPETILRASRIPIMILAFITGLFLFFWIRGRYGNKIGLLTVTLFALSPTVIAHSRYVTTDIAAAFGFLIGISSFVRFLEMPTRKRLLIAGLAFGVAQLLKFSLFLLVPIYLVLLIVWILVDEDNVSKRERLKFFLITVSRILLIFMIGVLIVWMVYAFNTWNQTMEHQLRHAESVFGGFKVKQIVELNDWLIERPITRPIGHYLTGLMMVTQRTAGGNSAYFLGEVSASGWIHYFPTVYILKETLAFHFLSMIALWVAIRRIIKSQEKSKSALKEWIKDNFAIFASIFFVAFYWLSSIFNPLNIGVRHILPTLPFIYFLVSREIVIWSRGKTFRVRAATFRDFIYSIYQSLVVTVPQKVVILLLLAWMIGSILMSYPFYLSYYNELAGGTEHGYWVATDSNYDWGQDLKRLANTVREYPEETIFLDYFGGSSPNHGAQKYYLGSRYKAHYSSFGPPPSGSIFAISLNQLMGNWAKPVKGFPAISQENTYSWLRDLTPIARGGSSILIYRIP
jgi:hypothetical protein